MELSTIRRDDLWAIPYVLDGTRICKDTTHNKTISDWVGELSPEIEFD